MEEKIIRDAALDFAAKLEIPEEKQEEFVAVYRESAQRIFEISQKIMAEISPIIWELLVFRWEAGH